MQQSPRKSFSWFNFLIRFVMGILGIALVLAVVIPTFFFFFFDPNDFKPQIAQFINRTTGLNLEIQGPISLTYLPNIAIKADNINTAQPVGFGETPFVHIESLELNVPVKALFKKHLHVTDFKVDGLKLNLMTKGEHNNWQMLIDEARKKNKPTTTTPKAPESPTPTNPAKKRMSFELSSIHVQNAEVTFRDEKQFTIVNNIQIQIEKSTDEQYRFKLHYQMAQSNAQQKRYASQGDIQGLFSPEKTFATFDAKSHIDVLDASLPISQANLQLEGRISSDTLSLSSIQIKSDALSLEGNAQVPIKNKQAPITFKLSGDLLNLDKLTNKDKSKSTAAPHTKAPAQPSVANVAAKSSPGQPIKGRVNFQTVTVKNLKLDNVQADIRIENQNLILAPVTASALGGTLDLKATTSLAGQSLIHTHGSLNKVNVAQLLAQLKQKVHIQGEANVSFDLLINNNITGTSNIAIRNGIIEGFDLRYYIHMAEALLKKSQNQASDTKQTPFGQLSAKLNIHDDMVETNDLTLLATDLKATGEGSVYLISQTLEFKVNATRLKDNAPREHDYPLALRIKGPISHPKVTPDLDVYLKLMMKEEVQKQLSKQVEKNLKKIISSDGEVKPEEVQEKIEKEISKGLKKLFKKKKDE